MKKLLLTLMFCLLATSVFATDFTQDVNCVAAYLFTEGSGTTVDDVSANTNTGNFKGSGEPAWDTTDVPFAVSGSAPNSVDFDGSNDFINIGTLGNFGTNLDTSTSTITCWVKSSTTTAILCVMGEVNTGPTTIFQLNLNLSPVDAVTIAAGKITVTRRDEDTISQIKGVNSNTGITNGNWHHLVWVQSHNSCQIWIDGINQTIYDFTTGLADNMANFEFNMYIGAQNNRGTTANSVDGLMTEFAIFNDALTESEITEIYNYGLTGEAASSSPPFFSIINVE